ncbi:MAG: 3-deoxy-D-manno-octulosonic acid transferase [Thiomicrospira sp.]|uniref:3-deoxy-D-manno-octulosonic acid transferase n=1 Tax=Thiomicrospira sp. TaxID=935 RepID=UPI0019E451DE|nr:glycosyltransferase N-terminal domain-containing protein [Thiomicrospira sp.]MBE0494387.1 3-deoxy-D-manno-octulosonic acid transferase [Thiomicrospira sp.]
MLYQFLIRLLSPLVVILIVLDAIKRQGGWNFIKQRLGLSYPTTRPGAIWLHCASVGEVKAVEALIKSAPQQAWLITTSTPSGFQTAEKLGFANTEIRYCPFDWPFAIRRFLKTSQPAELWVVETELWPNLYKLAHRQGLKIRLINARLSHKSLSAPNWLKAQYRLCLTLTSQILARSNAEAQRYIQLGAQADKVQILGNLKQAGLKSLPQFEREVARDYVLLASSHADEEVQISQRWQALQRTELLVIVPRHAKRGVQIQNQLSQLNLKVSLASRQQAINPDTQVFIDDRFGHLMGLFAHAKLVIMGGSFVAKGGHNFLEPAALKRTIITGWDNRDFEDELVEFQQHSAIIVCADYDKLQQRLNQLLSNQAIADALADQAYLCIQNQVDILKIYRNALNLAD